MLQRLFPDLYGWSDIDARTGRPGTTYQRNGFALLGSEAGVLALIVPGLAGIGWRAKRDDSW